MKKFKLVIFMASLVLIVAILAGCTSSNPVAEELAKQRAALTIGEFDSELHTITANGTELGSEESELFEVGSNVRLVVQPAEGYEFLGWDFDDNATSREITLVMYEDNTRITPSFGELDTGEVGAEGLAMQMETEPGNTGAGDNIQGPPAVIVSNNNGPVPGVEVTVSTEQGVNLDGTTAQVTNQNGIAIFDDLVINQPGLDYELVFDAEVTDIQLRAISQPFDVIEVIDEPGDGDNGETDPGDDNGDNGDGDNGETDPGDDNGDNGNGEEPGDGENGNGEYEPLEYGSINFNDNQINITTSGSGNRAVYGNKYQKLIIDGTGDEKKVIMEFSEGIITGAMDSNENLLNGEYELLILLDDYEGNNDENGYEFSAVFEDGKATGIEIPNWEFTVDTNSVSVSLPDDLYLKFK